MSDPGPATSSPGCSGLNCRAGLSLTVGRGLPVTARSLTSPATPGRLTSLRTRDLTLGGVFKTPKKTFEPNVHAVRRSKDELKEKIIIAPKKEKRERDDKGGMRENRGKRRERPQTIQSHSIFEQGPADSVYRTGWRGAADLREATASPVCKQVKERKYSEEDEDEILCKLLKDDFLDDPDLKNDSSLKPIQLPLYQSSHFIRSETLCSSTCGDKPPLHRPPHRDGRTEASKPEQPSLVQLLQDLKVSGKEELFFMQLPDCMPGGASELKTAAAPVGSVPEKGARKDDKRPKYLQAQVPYFQQTVKSECCPVLSQLPERLLGKLQIRRSGKVELKLGDIVMDVSDGAAFSFLQQLVSVSLSEGKTGDMMVLGNIKHKLVLSPDFHTLLRQASTQQHKES